MTATIPATIRCREGFSVPTKGPKTSCALQGTCEYFLKGTGCIYAKPELRRAKAAQVLTKEKEIELVLNMCSPVGQNR